MARQPYRVSPEKQLEVYSNFIGGLNTTTASGNLGDSEVTELKNMDLDMRGSMKRRYGMKSIAPKTTDPLKWIDLQGKTWKELI